MQEPSPENKAICPPAEVKFFPFTHRISFRNNSAIYAVCFATCSFLIIGNALLSDMTVWMKALTCTGGPVAVLLMLRLLVGCFESLVISMVEVIVRHAMSLYRFGNRTMEGTLTRLRRRLGMKEKETDPYLDTEALPVGLYITPEYMDNHETYREEAQAEPQESRADSSLLEASQEEKYSLSQLECQKREEILNKGFESYIIDILSEYFDITQTEGMIASFQAVRRREDGKRLPQLEAVTEEKRIHSNQNRTTLLQKGNLYTLGYILIPFLNVSRMQMAEVLKAMFPNIFKETSLRSMTTKLSQDMSIENRGRDCINDNPRYMVIRPLKNNTRTGLEDFFINYQDYKAGGFRDCFLS